MVREPLELPIVITVEDDGDKRHIEYAGDRLLSIGRAPDCSIVLEASRASRRHAEIVGEGGHYTLIDAGSANGTHLNGRRIEREGLRAGDVIQIGGATLTFGARARAPAAPPAAAPAVPAAPVAPAREGAPRRADPASAPGTGPAPAPGGTPASARRGRPSPFIRAVNIGVPVILIVILGLVIHRFLEEPPGRAGIPAGAPTSDTDPGTGVRWGSGTPEAAPAGESASQANRPPGLGDPIPPTVVTDAG